MQSRYKGFGFFNKAADELEYIIRTALNKHDFLLKTYDWLWGNSAIQSLPHYYYVIKPIYIFFGGKNNPLVSVPVTFISADLIFHQVLENLLTFSSVAYNDPAKLSETMSTWNFSSTVGYFFCSLPVAYYKYQQMEKIRLDEQAMNSGEHIDRNDKLTYRKYK